ncbi:MAG: hypothetical protein LBG29_09540 [Synergistaceae bacterium]|jgi:hypothetical protein|nr:hypothetical protein [Synergistaceae bacterium]
MPDTLKYTPVPVTVADDEILLRSIDTRHIKKDKITPYAFTPPLGRTDVSVMRFRYMSIENCKKHGKEIAYKAKNTFMGFAALRCEAAIAAGVDVRDSRAVFLGHADIIFSYPKPPKAEPNQAPEDTQAMSEFRTILKRLINASKLFLDPEPSSEDWRGEEIRL